VAHLLDTSAVLAHFLDEPGANVVSQILSGGRKKALLCAPSWVELERRLQELIPDADEAERVWKLYTQELCGFLPFDEGGGAGGDRFKAFSRWAASVD